MTCNVLRKILGPHIGKQVQSSSGRCSGSGQGVSRAGQEGTAASVEGTCRDGPMPDHRRVATRQSVFLSTVSKFLLDTDTQRGATAASLRSLFWGFTTEEISSSLSNRAKVQIFRRCAGLQHSDVALVVHSFKAFHHMGKRDKE